tara:strand:- start:774 stop:1043 length:270 start_codon:yes stop_codon:yes gene_type:complete
MCWRAPKPPDPPPPPKLPPPPPPPLEAPKPPPAPDTVVKEINPKVREARKGSKKAQGDYAKGTGSLRIPLNEQQAGQADPGAATGGINI